MGRRTVVDRVPWTDLEILAELRRRGDGRSAGPDRMRAAVVRATTNRTGLGVAPSMLLVGILRGRQRVVYGTDDRRDLYQVRRQAVRRAAEAVAALVSTGDLSERRDGFHDLATASFRESENLCPSEPYGSQPVGCFCSGVLVALDVVATAGHCIEKLSHLRSTRFVFGFWMLDARHARTRFPARDVYTGVRILGRHLTDTGADWALIQLDRPVSGRKPLPYRATGKIPDDHAVCVIGHPCGLPAKFADGARVRSNGRGSHFVANLDTYGGNSGSPVMDARTMRVEGLLVRGDRDFVKSGGCYVSLVCPTTGCRGEDVSRTTLWADKLRARKPGRRQT